MERSPENRAGEGSSPGKPFHNITQNPFLVDVLQKQKSTLRSERVIVVLSTETPYNRYALHSLIVHSKDPPSLPPHRDNRLLIRLGYPHLHDRLCRDLD